MLLIFFLLFYFQLCGKSANESEGDGNLLLSSKRQKCSPDVDALPVQQTVDTKEIACSISARTLEKIKHFSAFHCVNDEQMEFDGALRRENVESRKRKNEIILLDTWDSKQNCAMPSDKREFNKQESDILLLRYG
jgi:hypothetical protein